MFHMVLNTFLSCWLRLNLFATILDIKVFVGFHRRVSDLIVKRRNTVISQNIEKFHYWWTEELLNKKHSDDTLKFQVRF